jgi:hypothetical protein
MLAWKLVVEAQPLRSQGWSLSAIARHLGVKQVARSRLSERRTCPGSAGACGDRCVPEYVFCCWLRLSGELRAWLTTLFEEVAQLGQARSYQSFACAIRTRSPRPRCEACRQGRVVHDAARGCSRCRRP